MCSSVSEGQGCVPVCLPVCSIPVWSCVSTGGGGEHGIVAIYTNAIEYQFFFLSINTRIYIHYCDGKKVNEVYFKPNIKQ